MDIAELWAIFGPGIAGAVFGAGWWFWVDAVVCSSVAVSFVHYLPGNPPPIFLSLTFSLLSNVEMMLGFLPRDFVRDFCFFGGFDVQLCQERGH